MSNNHMGRQQITLQVNGESHTLELHGDQTLLAVSVLIDNRAISSCLMLAVQAEGREITTIEGLAGDQQLHPVQQAYIDHAAFQCAYCTPGFILSTVALLAEHPNPDDQTIREYLAGNLCRCGSYVNILEAVRACRDQVSYAPSHPV
jgi:aerobic-type carbon monoxide dehydrogenase small subunit (CoxS/CutS family)